MTTTTGVKGEEQLWTPREGGVEPSGPTVLEVLRETLEEFGLNGYEARVLLTLLQARSATASELASASGIGRTSVYPVLDSLTTKGLAEALPGKMWAAPGRDEVMRRLFAAEADRQRRLEVRMAAARDLLAKLPEDGVASAPYVQLLSTPGQLAAAFKRLLHSLESELLMFVRPRFVRDDRETKLDPVLLDTMHQRGVELRMVAEAPQRSADREAWHRGLLGYIGAGFKLRTADSVPVRLTIVDRRAVLLTLEDPRQPGIGYPTTQIFEHSGYAQVQADAFDAQWARSTPFEAEQRTKDSASEEREPKRSEQSGSGPAVAT